jgi:tetratricopeptide (TPR) repeat protein
MAVQLEQSPFLSIVPEERVQQTLQLMGRPADARLTPEVAREVCERTASAAVLDGSIASLGTQYVLGFRAKDCRSGNVLAEEQAQSARKEDVLKVLSQIASRFRAKLGESLTTVEQHNTPLETATTSSLEALKAYSSGVQISSSSGFTDALPLLKRAVEIDPQFAMAYGYIGLMESNLGESTLSVENTKKAYQLRDHASDRERFFITTLYERQVTGNLEREQQTLRLWGQTYPRDRDAHGLFAGFATHGSGQYEKAIEQAKIALGIDPDFAYGYINIATGNFYLDRLAEAEKAVQNSVERRHQTPDVVLLQYHVACVKGDRAEMDRFAALAVGKPGLEDRMLHAQALVAARLGRLQAAEALSHRAQDLARQSGQKESAASYQTAEAVWMGLYGNSAAARHSATTALELSNGRDVEYAAAFAFALAGDWPRSQTLARDLGKRFPEDTSVQFNYLPVLDALLALNRHDPQKAIEELQPSIRYELGIPAIDFNEFFGGLYPVYVRGEAFIAAGRSAEAAAEFRKILDHNGITVGDPIGAMALLQLGRTYVLSGDVAKAKGAYEDFLTLWKDADPDVPIQKKAKAEYARLR